MRTFEITIVRYVPLKAAAVQIDTKLGSKRDNLENVQHWMESAAKSQAQLVVFPECALTGYAIESVEQARDLSERIPGPSTEAIARKCAEFSVHVVVGLIEAANGRLYNSAALIGPSGVVGVHRKSHLPYLAMDRFVSPGDLPFQPFATPIGKIGIVICYDLRFPEITRILALKGAEIIAWPSVLLAIPVGSKRHPSLDFVARTRALENRVFLIGSNRIGVEGEWTYDLGRSMIIDVDGEVVAEAGSKGEQMIMADIDLSRARNKHMVYIPGKSEQHLFGDRRPELYGALLDREVAAGIEP